MKNRKTHLGHTKMPNWIWEEIKDLSPYDRVVLGHIHRWTTGFHRKSHYFEWTKIAKALNIDRGTAKKSATKLRQLNLISFKSNIGGKHLIKVNNEIPSWLLDGLKGMNIPEDSIHINDDRTEVEINRHSKTEPQEVLNETSNPPLAKDIYKEIKKDTYDFERFKDIWLNSSCLIGDLKEIQKKKFREKQTKNLFDKSNYQKEIILSIKEYLNHWCHSTDDRTFMNNSFTYIDKGYWAKWHRVYQKKVNSKRQENQRQVYNQSIEQQLESDKVKVSNEEYKRQIEQLRRSNGSRS